MEQYANFINTILPEGAFFMNVLNYKDQIQLIAHWLKTSKVEVIEGSVNKEIIRYNLRMEFDIQDEEVVDDVYDSITQ